MAIINPLLQDSSRPEATSPGFRFARLIFLLAALCCIASGNVTDFSIGTSGPHHVVQGHYMFFDIQATVITGTNEPGTTFTITGLPSGATASFVNAVRYCCGTTLWTVDTDNPAQISTLPTTPVGTYPLRITYTTAEGVQRSTTYTLYVDPVPALVTKPGQYSAPNVPLASLSQWQSNMTKYGLEHCNAGEMSNWEGFVWYYDGARVYYQIADYTGNPSWNTCAQMVASFYEQKVISANGSLPGYEVFAQGLGMNYQRAGDVTARQALSTLESGGLYTVWPNIPYIIPWSLSRETSYSVETNLEDQSLGGTPNPHLQDLVEVLFGDFDQWLISKNSAYLQPFMVALASEALIDYYNVSHDPRVPPILQMAADQIWASAWDPTSQSFLYVNNDGTTSTSVDLNLLIAPLYGWVYQQTGAKVYRDEGDQIFNAGVAGAWLDGGKQFSQNYRWSGKYVEWRTLAAQSSQAQQLSCDLNTDGNVNVLDVQLATNQVLGYATCSSADLIGNGQCSIVDVQRVISASLGASCHLGP